MEETDAKRRDTGTQARDGWTGEACRRTRRHVEGNRRQEKDRKRYTSMSSRGIIMPFLNSSFIFSTNSLFSGTDA